MAADAAPLAFIKRRPVSSTLAGLLIGALLLAGEVESWTDGVEEAAEAIDKGLAHTLLACWIDSTR